MSQLEIEAIAEFLGEEASQLRERAVRQDEWGWTLRERANGDCLFFEEGRCSIHAVKPRQCALYPFWFQNVRNEEAWKRTCEACPGIGQGPLISSEAIVRQVESDLERLDEREGLGSREIP